MKEEKYTKEILEPIVKKCTSVSGIVRELGLRTIGENISNISKIIKALEIDTSHFWVKNTFGKHGKPKPYEEVLIKNSTSCIKARLKKRMIKDGILRNECYECGLPPIWNNKELTLQIDHINGERKDHSLENLRLLCPNCHTQTQTFCGKNKTLKSGNVCLNCKKHIKKNNKFCSRFCANKLNRKYKIEWPAKEELIELIHKLGFSEVSERLGVSVNSIRKHIKNN